MIKVLSYMRRREGVGKDVFARYWLGEGREKVCALPGVRKYWQLVSSDLAETATAKPSNASAAPYDGVDEVWFDHADAARESWSSLRLNDKIIDADRGLWIAVREHVIIPGFAMHPGSDFRLLYLWRAKSGLSHQAARDYWYTRHAPLVPGTPALLQYIQGHALLGANGEEGYWTGSSELWFRNYEHVLQCQNSPQMAEQGADGPNFTDTSDPKSVMAYLVAREVVAA